ncbi:uncharacterized protein N7503_012052 [Penicillium pulvis]|uniref:uncharacterized protein n=1 Tax=Penicillium pulvis TaxID=1562058 RepID=UPI0025494210|nr:uncharacterized protein N7503_012052 [Penicillium pulvis]KAJ5786840.1 hypothetical protein N7503_012052 [Penicillium pulvis]
MRNAIKQFLSFHQALRSRLKEPNIQRIEAIFDLKVDSLKGLWGRLEKPADQGQRGVQSRRQTTKIKHRVNGPLGIPELGHCRAPCGFRIWPDL